VTPRLSIPSPCARHRGHAPGAHRIRQLCEPDLERQFADVHVALAVTRHRRLLRGWESPSPGLERGGRRHLRSKPEGHWLTTVPGLGDMLALTLLVETGTRARLPSVGAFASSGRGVTSPRLSHGKVNGHGHTKDGNNSLGWALVEAAHVAMRFAPGSNRFDQRQQGKRHPRVALKTVTHT
jgi:transposase